MPRAKRESTKYPGIYKREIHKRGRQRGTVVYDVKIGNTWLSKGKHTRIEDAKADRDRAQAELHNGGTIPRHRTFRDFAEKDWLPRQEARVSQSKLRSSTLRNYKRDLSGYLLPTFGDSRLSAISPEAVQRFSDRLSAEGKANWTVLRVVNTLSSVLTLARTYRLTTFNPVDAIEKPQARRRRDPYRLTVADVRRLADAAPTPDVRNLILVAAFTGARLGEPEATFHDLRHFFVSHIRNAGLPTAVTEQLVGHSDERTHRGYTHAVPGTEQMIRDALAAAFRDAPTKP